MALVGITALLVAACSDDDGPDDAGVRPSTTRPRLTTTAAPIGETRAVLDAYQGYWRVWLAATNPPDMFHPELRNVATGTAFDGAFNAIQAYRLQGRAVRLPANAKYEHRAEVVDLAGERATIRDCNIDDALVVETSTGGIVNDVVSTKLLRATMVLTDGRWKLADTVVERRWEGVDGCALE